MWLLFLLFHVEEPVQFVIVRSLLSHDPSNALLSVTVSPFETAEPGDREPADRTHEMMVRSQTSEGREIKEEAGVIGNALDKLSR